MVGWPYFHGIGANRSLPPSELRIHLPPSPSMRRGAVIFAKDHDARLRPDGIRHQLPAWRHPKSMGTGLEYRRIVRGSRRFARCRGRVCFGRYGYCRIGTAACRSLRARFAQTYPWADPSPSRPTPMRMAGPMGRRVDDIARLMTVLTRQDERDTWSFPADGTQYSPTAWVVTSKD